MFLLQSSVMRSTWAESRLSAACCNHQSPDGMLAEQQLFITQLGIQAEHIGLQNLELKVSELIEWFPNGHDEIHVKP